MSAKKKLLLFFGAYLVAAVVWASLYGPPGLSEAYLSTPYEEDSAGDTAFDAYAKIARAHIPSRTNRVVHEHYLEVVKSDAYKRWIQRPEEAVIRAEYERNPALTPAHDRLMAGVKFVEEYEARPAYLAEQHRTAAFHYFFEFFNALAVVVLVVMFAARPMATFVEDAIRRVSDRIRRATEAREEAAARKAAAEQQLAGLDKEKKRIASQTDALIEQGVDEIRGATDNAVAQLDEEAEQRKQAELKQAIMDMKRELVTESIRLLAERLRASASSEGQTEYVRRFADELSRHGRAAGGDDRG